jgi:23S rRNA pseudouridine955/2504/2580 synthase
MILTVRADDDKRRLDRILRKALPELPLSALHRMLRQGLVRVNGRSARGEDRIQEGAEILIDAIHLNALPGDSKRAYIKSHRPSAGMPPKTGTALDIRWEGAGLLILNKPAGLAVHGESPDRNSRRGTAPDTLERQVRAYLAERLPESLSFKPGPLHRLDKPTSGIIVFSKSLEGARRFSALLREGKIRKRYLALLDGGLTRDEAWEDMLLRDPGTRKTRVVLPAAGPQAVNPANPAAKPALTTVMPLACAREGGRVWTLARLEIGTGRTHQIRAQAARRGHPLSGDRKYGGLPIPAAGSGFFLHAAELELPEAVPAIRAPLPEAFSRVLKSIFGETTLFTAGGMYEG